MLDQQTLDDVWLKRRMSFLVRVQCPCWNPWIFHQYRHCPNMCCVMKWSKYPAISIALISRFYFIYPRVHYYSLCGRCFWSFTMLFRWYLVANTNLYTSLLRMCIAKYMNILDDFGVSNQITRFPNTTIKLWNCDKCNSKVISISCLVSVKHLKVKFVC